MNKIVFPQNGKVPEVIKEKVMNYVTTDTNRNPSLIKRWTLSKILVPNFVILFLVIGVFSYISARKQNLSPEIKPDLLINITNQISKTDNSIEAINYEPTLEDKLVEADILLQELENINNII